MKISLGRRTFGHLLLTAAAMTLATAGAQPAFPDKPLRLIVPQAAGGTGDTVTRLVAQGLSARLGQPVVVENRPGAGGTVGTGAVARAAADGYTLVLLSTGFATWTTMYPEMPFDPAKDLAPVAMMGSLPFAFLVRSDAPYKTVDDFVAYARQHPGAANYSSAGVGALSHLLAAWFAAEADIQTTHVPYGGTAPALSAMLGGQVDFYFDPVATSAALVESGKLKSLATTGKQRSPLMPGVPTFTELDLPVHGTVWLGLATTGGTPEPIVERLNREINAVLNDARVREQLEARGVTVEPMTTQAFDEFTRSEVRTWTQLVRQNDIKPN